METLVPNLILGVERSVNNPYRYPKKKFGPPDARGTRWPLGEEDLKRLDEIEARKLAEARQILEAYKQMLPEIEKDFSRKVV
ncbi:MAG: hypothetical protein AB1465_05765 [Patescibacteria group bacterium]